MTIRSTNISSLCARWPKAMALRLGGFGAAACAAALCASCVPEYKEDSSGTGTATTTTSTTVGQGGGGATGAGGGTGGTGGGTGGAAFAEETCNFKDDDGDGEVDEGFDWIAEPWADLFPTVLMASYLRAITLRDGRVAISGADSWGDGADRGYAAILSTEGNLLFGPEWTPILSPGIQRARIAEGGNDLLVGYESTDWAGCSPDCPVTVRRLDVYDLGDFPTEPHVAEVPFAFSPIQLHDLAWTAEASFVAMVAAKDGSVHLSQIDRFTLEPVSDRVLVDAANDGALAAGKNGIAWMTGDSATGTIAFGIFDVALGEEILPKIALEAQPVRSPGGPANRYLTWLGEDIVLTYQDWTDPASPPLISERYTTTGARVAGPTKLADSPSGLLDVTVLGEGLVVTTVNATDLTLKRYNGVFQPADGPAGPLTIPTSSGFASVALVEGGLVIVRGNAKIYKVDATLVHCGP